MRLLYIFIILILFQNCSFDNKTGIWKDESSNYAKNRNNDSFNEFENYTLTYERFNKIIPIKKNLKFKLANPITVNTWKDTFFDQSNNTKNFNYNELNKLVFKSKKITKYKINNYILFEEENIITSDKKGNLIIYSTKNNKLIAKFNFYKKKYKKIEKYLNLYVDNNTIYVSDNLGYLYAYNYKKDKILWAKNYKIPFQGNSKISNNKLITSNQNNNLYIFNKNNGEIIKLIPTEETIIKNEFKNNFSLNDKNLFFLNTFGTLYSINLKSLNINWFVNLNDFKNSDTSNLFNGSKIINSKNKIVVSSNQFTYIMDSTTGSIINRFNFSSLVKPVIIEKYLFLITKLGLLVSIDLNTNNIIFSTDINQSISNFLKVKKYKVQINNINILNNKIYIFLKNSYYLIYNLDGKLLNTEKLPSKINSYPIFIRDSILYLDFKNKLSVIR